MKFELGYIFLLSKDLLWFLMNRDLENSSSTGNNVAFPSDQMSHLMAASASDLI